MLKNPARESIPVQYTWKLEDIFKTDKIWEKEYLSLEKELPLLNNFKGKLNSLKELLSAYNTYEEIFPRLDKLYTYAHLRFDQDTTNSFYQKMYGKIKSLVTKANSLFSYFTPEIINMPKKTLQAFLQDPKLKKLIHALEKI